MTINSSANSVILILFAFSDNLSAENSKSSADFYIQRIQLLECMVTLWFSNKCPLKILLSWDYCKARAIAGFRVYFRATGKLPANLV